MRTGPAARMPRDVRARERLREAQQTEAAAVAGVLAANDVLNRAEQKREAALAAATAGVEQAQATLARAQGALVAVSGLDRAALLLGVSRSALRRSATPATTPNGNRQEVPA